MLDVYVWQALTLNVKSRQVLRCGAILCSPDADVCAVMTAQHKADASACSWCRRLDAAGSRDVAQMERQVADLLAQLQVEQRSHQLTREVNAWEQQLL